MNGPCRLAIVLLAGAVHAPGLGGAQTITGTIRDAETGEILENATVMVVDKQDSVRTVTLTGPRGEFNLRTVAGDTVRVRAERLGYRPMTSQLLLLAEASQLTLDILLHSQPIALAPVTVTAERWTRNREDFERRRRSEVWGRFVGPDRLAAFRSPRAVDRIRPFIPGLYVSADGRISVPKRGADFTGVPTCQPRLIVDGSRFPGDIPLSSLVSGSSIRALEYYREPQWAPGEFAMGWDPMIQRGMNLDGMIVSEPGLGRPCAIVVIWTERGFGPG